MHALAAEEPLSGQPMAPRLDIDLSAIRRNFEAMRQRYEGRDLSAVVKSDAYGLGLDRIAPALRAAGCTTFWVNDLDEAVRLRAVVPDATPFTLFGLGLAAPEDFARIGAIPVLTSIDEIERCAWPSSRGGKLPVAVQLDTGLGRLGLVEADVDRLAAEPDLLAPLDVRCWVSQLAAFDVPNNPMNRRQRQMLIDWTARLPAAPISLASSSGLFMGADWHFDVARIGSALFGVQTSTDWQDGLTPCYRLTVPVLRTAMLPAGSRVGYRGASELTRESRIATLALGYSNGLPQAFASVARAFVGDAPADFVGGMSMNLTMIDVTDLPAGSVAPGTQVTILGAEQTVDTVARDLDCAPNVLLTQIGSCCRRRYVDEI